MMGETERTRQGPQTWGEEPFRSVLPKLIQSMARDASRVGGQWTSGMYTAVAMMADDSIRIIMTVFGMGPVEEWLKQCAPEALAVGVFVGKPDELRVVRRLSSAELEHHVVPDWMRG
jgi:hypothetical protein